MERLDYLEEVQLIAEQTRRATADCLIMLSSIGIEFVRVDDSEKESST